MPQKDKETLCFKLVSRELEMKVNIRKEIACVIMGSLRTSKSFSLLGKNPTFWRSQVYEYQGSLGLATITEIPCVIKSCRNSQHRDSDNSIGERKMKTSVWPFCPNKRSY